MIPFFLLSNSLIEPSGIVETSEAITAEIVVAASIADLTLSANVAQVMGNTQ